MHWHRHCLNDCSHGWNCCGHFACCDCFSWSLNGCSDTDAACHFSKCSFAAFLNWSNCRSALQMQSLPSMLQKAYHRCLNWRPVRDWLVAWWIWFWGVWASSQVKQSANQNDQNVECWWMLYCILFAPASWSYCWECYQQHATWQRGVSNRMHSSNGSQTKANVWLPGVWNKYSLL